MILSFVLVSNHAEDFPMSATNHRSGASSVAEVASRNGLGKTTIWREIRDGRLKAVKVRDRRLILQEDEEAWRESLRHADVA